MMDINEIRWRNVRRIIHQLDEEAGRGGDRPGGLTLFAAKLKKSTGQAAHFAGETPIKGIGDKIAREIEVAFGLERGWMDWLQDGDETATLRQSHAVQLDPEIVESTHKAMSDYYTEKRWTYPASDVARFLLLYEKLALRKSGVSDAELFVAGTVEGVTPQGVVSERVVGVRGKGADAGVVAGRLRHEAKAAPGRRD